VEDELEIQSLAASQLERTRKAADNWRNGLAGLLALVSTIIFVKGRDTVETMSTVWKWALVLVLIASVAFAAYAARQAMKAAFGEIGLVKSEEVAAAGGWIGYQAKLAENAGGQLRSAQFRTGVALLLLIIGIVITWLAPSAPASPPALLNVTLQNHASVCGELTTLSAGRIQLKGQSPIDSTQVTSAALVRKC
jgi:hypothetical protein